jgi:hypothetical protein
VVEANTPANTSIIKPTERGRNKEFIGNEKGGTAVPPFENFFE